MKNIIFLEENRTVLAGDLNVFFDSKLETKGGKPSLKQKSVAKLSEVKEEYDLCDIWRKRFKKKSYIFRQNHSSDIINCRLDYIFISHKLQEFSNGTANIIPAFKTDPSSVLVIYEIN